MLRPRPRRPGETPPESGRPAERGPRGCCAPPCAVDAWLSTVGAWLRIEPVGDEPEATLRAVAGAGSAYGASGSFSGGATSIGGGSVSHPAAHGGGLTV